MNDTLIIGVLCALIVAVSIIGVILLNALKGVRNLIKELTNCSQELRLFVTSMEIQQRSKKDTQAHLREQYKLIDKNAKAIEDLSNRPPILR